MIARTYHGDVDDLPGIFEFGSVIDVGAQYVQYSPLESQALTCRHRLPSVISDVCAVDLNSLHTTHVERMFRVVHMTAVGRVFILFSAKRTVSRIFKSRIAFTLDLASHSALLFIESIWSVISALI